MVIMPTSAPLRSITALMTSVVPWTIASIAAGINALLARHNFILLGLRGQAKSRILRAMISLLDEAMPWLRHDGVPRRVAVSSRFAFSVGDTSAFAPYVRGGTMTQRGEDQRSKFGAGLMGMGQMMTKPYAAGGAYISRMSNYCKPCKYNPKNSTGDDACPFTTLYWDFLDRHSETFKKNHRMSQQIFGLNRLSDLPELKERAKEVLKGLEKGEI